MQKKHKGGRIKEQKVSFNNQSWMIQKQKQEIK